MNKLTNTEFIKLKNKIEELEKENSNVHNFWKTQPVPLFEDNVTDCGPIMAHKDMANRRTTPYLLPDGFEWYTLNINDDNDFQNISQFLNLYYLESDNGNYRFNYPPELLKWALCPPGYQSDLCIAVRIEKTKKLVAFISGILINMQVKNEIIKMADIDFLCIHPTLRNKNLASVLIKEITRRVVAKGHCQAFYASTRKLPTPITETLFYHRTINLEKLVDVGFTEIKDIELSNAIKYFEIDDKYTLKNFKKMEECHYESAYKILCNELDSYSVHIVFSYDEFKYWFVNDFVSSYVNTDNENNVLDFISYYKISNTVLKKDCKHKYIKMAYIFYYGSTSATLFKLGQNLLIAAKNEGIDVMTAIDIMHNKQFIDNLKFTSGTGKLFYYLFNYKCPELKPALVAKYVL